MDGLLLVDKASGWSSHDAVAYFRRTLGIKRVGHTGTLDPLATGLLIVLVGKATRLAKFFEYDDKEYLATLRLGSDTDTQDSEGVPIKECPVPVLTEDTIRAVFAKFMGEQMQTPPMYSAIKVGGKPLYKQARAGVEVERQDRRINISLLELVGFDSDSISFRVICSKGTYIRTLCRDMGEALGSCAHMSALRRSQVGGYLLGQSLALEGRPDRETSEAAIIPMERLLVDMPKMVVSEAGIAYIKTGRCPLAEDIISLDTAVEGASVQVLSATGPLLAVGEMDADGQVRMKLVMV